MTSHGPATDSDLAWWTGLPLADVRSGLAGAGARIRQGEGGWSAAKPRRAKVISPDAHLLPAFDEFAVGYKDRSAALARLPSGRAGPQIGLLSPCVLVDGEMVGTWTRSLGKARALVKLRPLVKWTREEREAIEKDADRYASFLGLGLTRLG